MLNVSRVRGLCAFSSWKGCDTGFAARRLFVESERAFVGLPRSSLFYTPIRIPKATSSVPISPPHSLPKMDIITSVCSILHLPLPSTLTVSIVSTIVCLLIAIRVLIPYLFTSRPRQTHIPAYRERVLILGASNEKGVGEALALAYAKRGCGRLVLVARNQQGLQTVRQKCIKMGREGGKWEVSDNVDVKDGVQVREKGSVESRIKTFKADCSDARDIDSLRKFIQTDLGGLDTLHICFGVSALLPLLGVAGVDPIRPSSMDGTSAIYADEPGLDAVFKAVNRASEVNLTGTAVVLAAFIPVLQTTSTHPSIALTSSAAALFPAPTRSIYGATKTAQLSLFRSVAVECQAHAQTKGRADIRFLAVCPGTIATSFRSSAVDLKHGDNLPQDSAWGKKAERMLTSGSVAERTILGVDRLERGQIVMPQLYALARWIEMIYPAYIAKGARKKYHY